MSRLALLRATSRVTCVNGQMLKPVTNMIGFETRGQPQPPALAPQLTTPSTQLKVGRHFKLESPVSPEYEMLTLLALSLFLFFLFIF